MREPKEFLCSDTEEHYLKNRYDLKHVPTLSACVVDGKVHIDGDEVEDSVSVRFTPERAMEFAKELVCLAAIASGTHIDPRVEVSIGVAFKVTENTLS